MSFKKYKQSFILEWKYIIEYKFDFLFRVLKPLISIFVLSAIWIAIFTASNKETIAGFTQSQFVTYIILASFVKTSFFAWRTGELISNDIRLGSLTSYITKPINYILLRYAGTIARMLVTGFYAILIFFLWQLIAYIYIPHFFIPIHWYFIPLFLLSLFLAFTLAFLYYFIIASSAFWWGETWSILGSAIFIQSFFSGEFIPLHIHPLLLQISTYLPFKSMVYIPTSIYLGSYSFQQILIQIAIQCVWVIALYGIAAFIYKKGISRFEAQGG